jgi:hypothetical protein
MNSGRRGNPIPACMFALSATLLSPASSWAQADNSAASSAQVATLVDEIKAHFTLCDPVGPSQATLYQQCANEKAGLVARQKQLGVSDETINAKLTNGAATRGQRWP